MAALPPNYGSVSSLLDKPITPCLEWTGASFDWPCSSTKSLYKSSGKYISKNVIATRAQIVGDDVFVALPRYKSGVPATLAKTNFKKGQCSAVLKPFPCWASQEEGNCQSLQSVVDIVVDKNDIVWALDVGVVNTLESPVRKCPPKVVAMSAKTGKVLKIISLDELVVATSRLQYLVVDYATDNRCFVYISDAAQRSIIVYDVQASRGFRVILPKAVTAGCPKRDVLYLALARKSCGTSVLYFTYLSSPNLFLIKTEFLRSGNAQGRVTGELQFNLHPMTFEWFPLRIYFYFCLSSSLSAPPPLPLYRRRCETEKASHHWHGQRIGDFLPLRRSGWSVPLGRWLFIRGGKLPGCIPLPNVSVGHSRGRRLQTWHNASARK